MKKRFSRSIGFRIIALYAVLSVINLSFVISIIFENQVDLISKNTMLESERQLSRLVEAMKTFSIEISKGGMFGAGSENDILSQLVTLISPHYREFIIFSEKGTVTKRSSEEIILPQSYREDGLRSITASAFSGSDYYLRVDAGKNQLYFYIPLNQFYPGNSVLFIKKDIGGIGRSLAGLYRQAVYVIVVVVFFHVVFAVVLYRRFIYPLNRLSEAALKITVGDMNARVELPGKIYEFDTLAEAFNNMAESVSDSISMLSDEVEVAKDIKRRRDRISTRDELTGLLNSSYINERINEELSSSGVRASGLSVIAVDIDGFGRINEMYGKQTGDIIIKETARTITGLCVRGSIAARSGGEEFIIISPEFGRSETLEFAEMLRKKIEENSIITPDGAVSVTVSIGAAYIKPENIPGISDAGAVIENAMTALSMAKNGGRNRIEFSS